MSSASIFAFINRLEQMEFALHSILIVRRGQLLAEGYWKPFHRAKTHRLYSCSKSFVSIAIGFMIAEGKLTLDDRVADFFPDKHPNGGVHPYIASATVRHLLMMASPHEHTAYTVLPIDDWTKAFFHCAPSHWPGSVFSYDTSATHVLTAIVERLSGSELTEYLWPRLLEPLGIGRLTCIKDPVGTSWGGSGILCTPMDFAKVALCCMQNGMFDGKQIIPADYIRAATAKQIDTHLHGRTPDMSQGYGYQFWRLTHNAFAFVGMGGQLAVCVPDTELLVVLNGDDQWQENQYITQINAIWDILLPGLSDAPLPTNDADTQALAARLSSLTLHSLHGHTGNPIAQSVHDTLYTLDTVWNGFHSVRFRFTKERGVMTLYNDNGAHIISFGMGHNVLSKFPIYGYDCAASAIWDETGNLLLQCYVIDNYFATLRIAVHFDGARVTLHMKKVAEMFMDEFTGCISGHSAS